ncbi:MAG TPA: FliH/SctL family protein [Allosphingosinicella sp.]|nr:FliH/SctL family protein [Allosphingosinicella sp.]
MSRLLRAVDAQAESLGSFVLNHKEAGFRPRNADGGFTADNDEEVLPLTPDQERARIEEEAFALGHAEGRREAELDYEAERDALARLAQSLQVLRPEPANALALLLAETVDRLVREVVGQVEVDATLLLSRAQQAAALVAKDVEPTKLRAHPDDIVHLEHANLAVALEADPGLARGSIVLETGDGWIEDGPAVRLERLRAELDRMGAPQ